MKTSVNLIERIRSGEDDALEQLYISERIPFLAWARKHFQCSEGDAKELFQVIVLIAYDNIISGRLQNLQCTMRSYLYAVAKNKWREWTRARQKIRYSDVPYFANLLEQDGVEQYSDDMVHLMNRGLERMGKPCQQLLDSFYHQKMSMLEIANKFGYKNPDTVKNLKYKCLQRLRRMVASNSEKSTVTLKNFGR